MKRGLGIRNGELPRVEGFIDGSTSFQFFMHLAESPVESED
jgi:hypothetical protein